MGRREFPFPKKLEEGSYTHNETKEVETLHMLYEATYLIEGQ